MSISPPLNFDDTIDVFYDVIKYDDDDVYFDARRAGPQATHLQRLTGQAVKRVRP